MTQQDDLDRPPASTPGWYPDPWVDGARRYWTGSQWAAMSFPDRTVGDQAGAAARAGETNPFAERAATTPEVPPPVWVRPDGAQHSTVPTDTVVLPVGAAQPLSTPASPGRRWAIAAVAGAAVLALALIAGFVASRGSSPTAAPQPLPSQPAPSPSPPPTPTPSPSDPGSATPGSPRPAELGALAELGLRQRDVEPGVFVLPIDGGLQVQGEVTLDLCDGTFPSETQRTARVQVAGYQGDGTVGVSTEVVQYASSGAVDQAWDEIREVARTCSSSAPGTALGPTPDASWPHVDGVRRLAYDLQTTDATGQSGHYVVVYLSRGNVLLGVYFPRPEGTQMSVEGQDTVPAIVHVFEKRLAQLPPTGLPEGSGPGAVGPTA